MHGINVFLLCSDDSLREDIIDLSILSQDVFKKSEQ